MSRVLSFFAVSILAIACSGKDSSIFAPEEIETDQGPAMKLSYVANPSNNGTRCMYDRPGILYWSSIGITATILQRGQWVYYTYSWEYVGVDPSEGELTYGINNGTLIFPGELRAVWEPDDWR